MCRGSDFSFDIFEKLNFEPFEALDIVRFAKIIKLIVTYLPELVTFCLVKSNPDYPSYFAKQSM